MTETSYLADILVLLVASFAYLAFFTEVSAWLKALIALLMLYGATFILSKPSRVPKQSN
ncbi:MAG: hypothetical protein JSU75_01460 [Gammaproteobacteria bacterium]|nr:MAG: hypothetical protein JSU75_01460 [Gammaproteobacteria bacterium]